MSTAEKKLQDELKAIAKLTSNKPCFDCGLAGPQANAVLAPYNIFVCQTCAGLHRSLNHKVKGISMSKFSREEIDALKDGGNKRARAVWFAKYDETKEPSLKPAEVNKIKERMEKCYEKKTWYDENGKPKKKKPKTDEKKVASKSSASVQDEAPEPEEEETKKDKDDKKPKKPVASANVLDDLLSFNEAPAEKEKEDNDEENPFEEEEEDDDNPFTEESAPAPVKVQAPASNGTKAQAPISNDKSPTPAAVSTGSGSPEAAAVALLVNTYKEIGMKYRFPKDKMLALIEESLNKVGLGPLPSKAAAAAAPATAPVPKHKAPEPDLFADAETRTAPLIQPAAAQRTAPSSGPTVFAAAPPASRDNPFEIEDDNPFSSPKPAAVVDPRFAPGFMPNPAPVYPGAFAPGPAGPGPFAPGPFGPGPYPGAVAFAAPNPYPNLPFGGQAPGQYPAAMMPLGGAPPAQPQPKPAVAQPKKDDLFKEFGMF